MRIVKTSTASAVPTGLANGAASSSELRLGRLRRLDHRQRLLRRRVGLLLEVLDRFRRPAELVPSLGALTTRRFSAMLARYSGSFAASETAWRPATHATAADEREAEHDHDERRQRRGRASSARGAAPPARAGKRAGWRARTESARRARGTGPPPRPAGRRAKACVIEKCARSAGRAAASAPVTSYTWPIWNSRLFDASGKLVSARSVQPLPPLAARQLELHHVLPGVEDDEQRRVLAAAADAGLLRAAVEQHAEAAHVGVVPVLLAHLLAGRR